jgi:hypothetical protein
MFFTGFDTLPFLEDISFRGDTYPHVDSIKQIVHNKTIVHIQNYYVFYKQPYTFNKVLSSPGQRTFCNIKYFNGGVMLQVLETVYYILRMYTYLFIIIKNFYNFVNSFTKNFIKKHDLTPNSIIPRNSYFNTIFFLK